ncbi:hypothetical protein ID866_9571 [Astraeus odoratus]|nr:hypothetical protein ID866_9571 [Astraeus odoratus]
MTTSVHRGGTAAWLAPEVIDGSPSTMESDVWAYGMTVLELLTAKRPYHGIEKIPAIMFKILKGPPPRPSDESTCSRMTDEWWDLCSWCWRRDPPSRPAISDVIEKLDQNKVCVLTSPRIFSRLGSYIEACSLALQPCGDKYH